MTYLSTQTDTSDITDVYSDTTRMYLFSLHKIWPRIHPRFNINWMISGIPNNMIKRSAIARFIMKMFVTDCLIFLSKIITHITRKFPTIPTSPIWQKRIERPMMVSVDAGSIGENKVLFISLEQFSVLFTSYVTEFDKRVVVDKFPCKAMTF